MSDQPHTDRAMTARPTLVARAAHVFGGALSISILDRSRARLPEPVLGECAGRAACEWVQR